MSQKSSGKVIVVGAGLCGTLLALRLAQRGYKVQVYERRADIRTAKRIEGRSINLALSDRGIKGLELVGLKEKANMLVVPMEGRMVHSIDSKAQFTKYSGRSGDWINSISRGQLNMLLIDEAEKTGSVSFAFSHECHHMDVENGQIQVRDTAKNSLILDEAEVIFGTDGANSAIRNVFFSQSAKFRFDYHQKYLDTGYKELEIPAGSGGSFLMEKNALHIWPREGFMMIALPNLHGSFTVTLFLPFEGVHSFASIQTNSEIESFFNTHFASAAQLMPDLIEDFHQNPTSSLGTIKCFPWQYCGKVLLMGDAAHAIVPFYGQGMNASFEDVVVLDPLIDQFDGDWNQILPMFERHRKIDTDAIADLAQDNFYEMRDATADPIFTLKRKIELHLEQNVADYYSKYSMVTFREDLPYSTAMNKGRAQDRILMAYASEIGHIDRLNVGEVLKRLESLS